MDSDLLHDPAFVAFLEDVEVDWVEVVSLRAEKHSPAKTDNVEVKISGGTSTEGDHFLARFEAKATVTDKDDQPVADFDVALVIKFSSSSEPIPDLVETFARTTGVRIATPYLRENLSSLAQRVSVDGVLLPLVRGSELHPDTDDQDE